jgi:hypothetical protein
MNVKSILGNLFNFSLNGEVAAAKAVGVEHGRELAGAYVSGLREGALEALSEGRSVLLGLTSPEPETIPGEVVAKSPSRRKR